MSVATTGTVPSEADCKILFNSVAEQWGAFDYDAGKDVAAVSVPARAIGHVETFEISVDDEGVTLAWADRACSFAVGAASAP